MKLFVFLLFMFISANEELEKTIEILEKAVNKKERKLSKSLEA